VAVNQSQYATTAQLASLSLTPQAAARYGEAAMNASLQAASSRADTYLTSQFTLPLTSWDMQLTRVVCDMAAFDLARQYGLNPSAPDFKAIESLFNGSIDWLVQVREHKLTPLYEDSGSGDSPGSDEGGPFIISDAPVGFTGRGQNFNDSDDGNPRGLP
jgi:phage gp36-like protein